MEKMDCLDANWLWLCGMHKWIEQQTCGKDGKQQQRGSKQSRIEEANLDFDLSPASTILYISVKTTIFYIFSMLP